MSVVLTSLAGGAVSGGADLSAVAESVVPTTAVTYDLGASGFEFNNLHVSKIYSEDSCGSRSIDVALGLMKDSTGATSVDFSNRALVAADGTTTIFNFSGNERLEIAVPLRLPTLATAPATGSAGDMYYDTVTNKSYTYDGSTWQAHW